MDPVVMLSDGGIAFELRGTAVDPGNDLARPGRPLLYNKADRLTIKRFGKDPVDFFKDQGDGLFAEQPGTKAFNILRVASNVVSATYVQIGADRYEIEIVNTDSTDTTGTLGDFNNTTNPLTVPTFGASYPHVTVAVGALIRIGNEIMRVRSFTMAPSGLVDKVVLQRGASGTTIATHGNSIALFVGDGIAAGSTVRLGLVTTLTPTAFTPALVGDINSEGTYPGKAEQISVNEMLLTANAVGVDATAVSETLAGANNAWDSATMHGGSASGAMKLQIQSRIPSTQEVAIGNMHFAFDFNPTVLAVLIAPTATPGIAKAWDGAVTVAASGSGYRVTLDNTGSTDWAATDTVVLIVKG